MRKGISKGTITKAGYLLFYKNNKEILANYIKEVSLKE
jgi:hypothetical protein